MAAADDLPTKSILKSKTLWVNLIIACGTYFTPLGAFVQAHPQGCLIALACINKVLRLISGSRLALYGSES